MTIGEKIATRRKELGLTLQEIGSAVGVGKSTVKKWESGYIANMRRDKIAALAKILQLSPAEFIGDESENTIPTQLDVILTADEKRLLEYFRNFNEEGQEKLLDTASDMAQLDRYKKGSELGMAEKEA